MKLAIIGAGPAGLACAVQVAKLGHEVTVFERRSNSDSQGSGVVIQPIGLASLEVMGLRNQVEAAGQKLLHVKGYTRSGPIVINADYTMLRGRYDYALGISRNALWSILYKEANALKINFQWQIAIVEMITCEGKSTLLDKAGNSLGEFDFVIDASGASSALHRYSYSKEQRKILKYGSLWAKVALPKGSTFSSSTMTLYSDKKNRGVGIMPIGQAKPEELPMVALFFNLDWQDCPKWDMPTFLQWKKTIAESWPDVEHLLDQIEHYDQLHLAKFKQHTLSQPFGDSIVFVGDAAHSSSPQLGQGINMSLVDAVVFSQALSESKRVEHAFRIYAKNRSRHVQIYQSLAKFLTPFYQSDNKLAIHFRNHFFSLFSGFNSMTMLTTHILSGRVGDPLKAVR